MKIVKRNKLRRGGFAGLRETRLVMSPKLFRRHTEAGTLPGIGGFAYLADARFLPHGETRMHTHREIDVISVMVEGRIQHQGSLQDGQELQVDDIQVQRAGDEGFSHNEVNPDPEKNRMIQLWVIPESSDAAPSYKMYRARDNSRTRVYGGPSSQSDTVFSRTIIEIVHLEKGESLEQPGRCLAYITVGSGQSKNETLREGYLVETRAFNYMALSDSKLILIYEDISVK